MSSADFLSRLGNTHMTLWTLSFQQQQKTHIYLEISFHSNINTNYNNDKNDDDDVDRSERRRKEITINSNNYPYRSVYGVKMIGRYHIQFNLGAKTEAPEFTS